MEDSNEKQDNALAFTPDPLEDLTIQDALIISAVHAVQADPAKCKRISRLAQRHPLFVEDPENTTARVNKYVNLMQAGETLQAVEAVTECINPEQRQQAFEFAAAAAVEEDDLTNDKKQILQELADRLALDNHFVDRKLATIQDKSV